MRNMFQFHKVRLKGSFPVHKGNQVIQFQFHKVRLKDSWSYDLTSKDFTFQFHKVRLKDMDFLQKWKDILSFNSIRYD